MPRSKIQVPSRPSGVVGYDRLACLLPDPSGASGDPWPPVTLVCAPAGYGKTTLVSSWAAGLESGPDAEPVAWADLDTDDDSPFAFWSTLLAAIGRSGVAGSGLEYLRPQRGMNVSHFLAAVLERLDELDGRWWLVLDHLQEIHDRDTLHSLDTLTRRLPAGLGLVLVSRMDPALSLHRLRLDGRMREIRMPELAFDRDEAAAVLAAHDITLSGPDLDVLMGRTEGWPTGVRLAALALAHSRDHSEALAHFAEDDHTVADYLVGEILRGLPADLLRFLLLTSVCDRFTPALAGALTGRADAGEVIDRLERGNVLLTRCGTSGSCFRYHELLQAHLRATLNRTHPEEIPRLHRVAANWFAGDGQPLTALQHAAATGDDDLTGALLGTHGLLALVNGASGPLRRLADELPASVTCRRQAAVVLALADLDEGDVAAADVRLRVPADGEPTPNGRTEVLGAVVDTHRARLTGGLVPAVARMNDLGSDHVEDRDVAMLVLLNRAAGQFCLGRHELAEDDLRHAMAIGSGAGRDYLMLRCLNELAAVSLARGDYASTRHRAQEALRFAAEHDWSRAGVAAYPYAVAAWAAHQSLTDDADQRFVALARDLLPRRPDPATELLVRSLAAATVRESGGGPYDALVMLRAQWSKLGRGTPVHPALVALGSAAEVRGALRLGELAWAAEAVRRARSRLGDSGDALLSRAMVLAHRGCTSAARTALHKVTRGGAACHLVDSLVEANLLLASMAEHAGDHHEAHTALVAALDLAARTQSRRPFLDGREPIRTLLVAHVGRLGRLDPFVEDLLTRLPAAPDGMVGALTPREHELLIELPSMRTTDEIADGLFLSVNTVKTHLRSVYRKLGVSSRREAIVAARTLGLL